MTEIRQSPQWGTFLRKLGWQTEVIDGCALRIRKLGPLGSVIKIQRPGTLPLEEIDKFTTLKRALFVKVEPINEYQVPELKTYDYQPDTWPLTPPRTSLIDLTQTEEELLKSFSKDTRQTLKKIRNEELGIRVVNFEEIDEEKEKAFESFYQVFKETGKRGGFWVPPYSDLLHKVRAFGKNAVLIVSWSNSQKTGPGEPPNQLPDPGSGHDNHGSETPVLLAGCLLLICEGIGYYHHAASTYKGQKLEAPYAVMWQSILESKKRGMEKLDLEGIFDPRFKFMNSKAWHNFSTFKLKWGGHVFEYPGSYIKVYNPLVKMLFSLERYLT